jgi:hypothetical protein
VAPEWAAATLIVERTLLGAHSGFHTEFRGSGRLSDLPFRPEPLAIVVKGFLYFGIFHCFRRNRLEYSVGFEHGAARRGSLDHLNLLRNADP